MRHGVLRFVCVVVIACCMFCCMEAPRPVDGAVDTTTWFRLVTVEKDLSITLNGVKQAARAIRVGTTVMVPFSILRDAWGTKMAVSGPTSALTIGTSHVTWDGMSDTFHLGLLDFPWDTPPMMRGGQRYFAFRQLMQPLGAYIGIMSSTGALFCAYSTQWQKEPWLRQTQLKMLETMDLKKPSISRGPASAKVVAFTFDDNWDSATALNIAELFHAYNGHCTFFVVGTQVRAHPDVVRRMVLLGHDIGNHTHSHAAATAIPQATLIKQVQACEQVLNGLGLTSRPYFRFPYFADDAKLVSVISGQGYLTIGSSWTILDTVANRSAALIAATIRKYVSPGVIFVGHANSPMTYQAIKAVLPELAKQGYRFVSLTELLSNR